MSAATDLRQNLIDTAFRGMLAIGLYLAFPAFSDVYRLWKREHGLYPEWPAGPLEYPPVSALYFEPLSFLPSGRWAVAINGLVMVAAAVGVTWLLMRRAKSSDGTDVDVRLWVGSPALLLFLPINWDVLVVLIAVLGVVALYQQRVALSGLWHGVGTAFKLFPGAVVFPVLPLIDGWRRRVVFLATGFIVLVGPYLIYAAVSPEGWRFHLDFSSLRTDIDSTIWGTLQWVLGAFGVELPIGLINTVSTVAILVGITAVTIWAAKTDPTFAEVAVLAIIVLLVFYKVVKPQYVLWLIPFVAWIRASKLKMRLVEVTAIIQFVAIYFAWPEVVFPVEAAIRAALLAALALEVVRRVSAREVSQQR